MLQVSRDILITQGYSKQKFVVQNYWKIATGVNYVQTHLGFYLIIVYLSWQICVHVRQFLKYWITLVNCSFQLNKHWHRPNFSTWIDQGLDWWHWCMVTFKWALVWSIMWAFSKNAVSITQSSIAFLKLLSITFCRSLCRAAPIKSFKVYWFWFIFWN